MKRLGVISGQCLLFREFLDSAASDRLFDAVLRKTRWQSRRIRMFGREHEVPRRVAWHGDADAVYTYSGTANYPAPWFAELHFIRERVEQVCGSTFNSVLLNLYRDGRDCMGRHSDDEPELGRDPVIASVSLGATRRFVLHPRSPGRKKPVSVELEHGSLLLMFGACQRQWRHSLPRSARAGRRINLTYRRVFADTPAPA